MPQSTTHNLDVYQPRNPKASAYYKCVENHFEELERAYPEGQKLENMLSWRHSGFHVYIGDRITPSDKTGLGNLARYIIRACFSQERMVYVPAGESTDGIAKVVYTSKDRKSRKVFSALDWLARLVTHIPGRYEQTVRDAAKRFFKFKGLELPVSYFFKPLLQIKDKYHNKPSGFKVSKEEISRCFYSTKSVGEGTEMERMGFRVTTSTDSLEALEIFSSSCKISAG